jgi:hypothetical protein
VGFGPHLNLTGDIKKMKSDVKATQKTSDGLVFAGRTRLRGIVLGAPNTTDSRSCRFFKWNNVVQLIFL